MDIVMIFLGIALILFFGYFAEYIFKRFHIPDVLFLIFLGVLLGKHGFNTVSVDAMAPFAPIFTYFTLLFLLFDGAFSIDLKSFVKGLSSSFILTFFNFVISSIGVAGIMMFFGFPFPIALLAGFILGGVSSSYVIPLLKNIRVSHKTYTILTFESAFTDVLCIVFSLTMMRFLEINSLDVKFILTQLVSFFSVAGFIGIIAGILWIFVLRKTPESHKSYVMTIAFLTLIYSITEFVGGNGAIAGLFMGIILRNSKQLSLLLGKIVKSHKKHEGVLGVISGDEVYFYHQISFFLKTFFFVYVGLLLDVSNPMIVVLAVVITLVVFVLRGLSHILTKQFDKFDRDLITSIIARGLAAAAISQIAIEAGIPYAEIISKVVYVVVTLTIFFSSMSVYMIERKEFKKHKSRAKISA